jgi:hypothetical protein
MNTMPTTPDALKLAAKLRERYGATVLTSQAAALLEQQHAALESLESAAHAEIVRQRDENTRLELQVESLRAGRAVPEGWRKEYEAISEFYGERTAARSRLSLMRHIDDGLHILDIIGASDLAKAAYCLHPIVQNSEPIDVSWSPAFALACEYRDKANAFLCRHEHDGVSTAAEVASIVGAMSYDCRVMLVADKRQNYADFIVAHYGKHDRSQQLDKYFRLWLEFLEGISAAPTPPQAEQAGKGEAYAYAVYFQDQPTEVLVHDLEDLVDDMTNRRHVVTPLFDRPAPQPDDARDAVQRAVLAEREACARVCDVVKAKSRQHLFRSGASICAGEIRALTAHEQKAGELWPSTSSRQSAHQKDGSRAHLQVLAGGLHQ